MSKMSLLFALKCSIILYFAACTSIEQYTVAKATTPIVTQGSWKVNLFMDTNKDKTNDFAGYTFRFNISGDVQAIRNGVEVKGHWAEDNISQGVTLDLDTEDPALVRLNNYWTITSASNAQVGLQNNGNSASLNITSL